MEIKHYIEKIENSINEMDKGNYKLALFLKYRIIKIYYIIKKNNLVIWIL